MTKMKGILKGLRYITQMFDHTNQGKKERELQIGLPTDVKHVAHIGWDGPSAAAPSWMNEFRSSSTSELSRAPSRSREAKRSTRTKVPLEDSNRRIGGTQSSPAHDSEAEVPKRSRRRQSSGASSTTSLEINQQEANVPKQSRRNSSSMMASSPVRDATTAESTKKPTRRGNNGSNSAATSPKNDSSGLPPSKQSKKKKTKGSGEATRRRSSIEEPVMRSSGGAKSLSSSLEELHFEGNRAVGVS
ncbi:hypothetical protein Syun_029894 [Stephania yunnanensis]|uniref:CRIB domain-containing protein n=1 Tax=Stephania yunnanensis TaxID=152371 RepID=A0AAP0E8T7_9MAGN